jgi:hypothetical protein
VDVLVESAAGDFRPIKKNPERELRVLKCGLSMKGRKSARG